MMKMEAEKKSSGKNCSLYDEINRSIVSRQIINSLLIKKDKILKLMAPKFNFRKMEQFAFIIKPSWRPTI